MTKHNSEKNHLSKIDVDDIIDSFRINVNSLEPIKCSGTKDTTRVYRVNYPKLIDELYIIDTPDGREVACKPHIVGKAFTSTCFNAALEAVKIIESVTNIKDDVVIEHVLRAAPGYGLYRAFKTLHPKIKLRKVWIRPRYTKPSYRDHDDNSMKLEIVYEDFNELPSNTDFTIIKPDTEATGLSGKLAIERVMKHAEKIGSRIERVILYGFISQEALHLLQKYATKNRIDLIAFAMEDVMELAYNKYDMTLYGLDLAYWDRFQKLQKLSSITPREVLEDMIPCFVPGSDQPGDFSSRQKLLFNGKNWETGPIFCHLTNSIRLISRLQQISENKSWYRHEEIFKERMKELRWTRLKYLPHSLLYPKETFSCIIT